MSRTWKRLDAGVGLGSSVKEFRISDCAISDFSCFNAVLKRKEADPNQAIRNRRNPKSEIPSTAQLRPIA